MRWLAAMKWEERKRKIIVRGKEMKEVELILSIWILLSYLKRLESNIYIYI